MERLKTCSKKIIKYNLDAVPFLTIMMFFFVVCLSQDTMAHGWKAPKEAIEKQNPIEKTKTSIHLGRELYTQFCSDCHGKNLDGSGPTAGDLKTKPPNLKQRDKYHHDGDFFWKIENGKGEMPGFKEDLQKKEIWHIINYIKSFIK